MADIKVVVNGVLGKMGQEVLNAVAKTQGMKPIGGSDIAAVIDQIPSPTGEGFIPVFQNIKDGVKGADVVVDFTNASGAKNVMEAASPAGVNCVIGSTGLSEETFEIAKTLADSNNTSIIIAPNFAMGAVLMSHLVKKAARFFDYADLTEVHHEAKIDAPSGTAIAIAQAAADGKNSDFNAPNAEKQLIEGTRGGLHGGVVIHSGRMPGRVAHHEMVFGSLGQTLTIRHDSINRESFMPGVIMAIKASSASTGLTVGLDKIMGL
jgi:4-hydroxy-tetrahydrodipicolinate reductase